jgi:hypothetical protein
METLLIIYLSGLIPAYYYNRWCWYKCYPEYKEDRDWGEIMFLLSMSIVSWLTFLVSTLNLLINYDWSNSDSKPPKWL